MSFFLKFIDILFNLIYIIVILRVLLSWIKPDPSQAWVQFIVQLSEPILSLFRWPIFRLGMLDFSPIVAMFAISIAHRLVIQLIHSLI